MKFMIQIRIYLKFLFFKKCIREKLLTKNIKTAISEIIRNRKRFKAKRPFKLKVDSKNLRKMKFI